MSSNRLRRIAKEIEEAAADTHSKVVLQPAEGKNDLTHLEGQIQGPPDTPYEGGRYIIDIRIPNDYPFRPPSMKFTTKIWHPNVSSQTGAICLDTLSTGWTPVFTIKSALISVQGLLASPEPKDPQDAEVAGMLLKNPKEFAEVARKWAIEFAGASAKGSDEADSGETSRNGGQKDGPQAGRDSTTNKLAPYRGYPRLMVDRFTDMGFEMRKVIAAFDYIGIEKNDGQDYELEEAVVEDIMVRLFGDS